MSDGLDPARALLPDLRLSRPARLPSSDRAVVTRVRATGADGADRSLVVKQYGAPGEGWVRECAALSVLPDGAPAPRLVAASADPPIVVLTDAGDDTNLAEVLLGGDGDRAARLVVRWAESLARVHVATRDLREPFRAALEARAHELDADLRVGDARVGTDIDDALRVLERLCGMLGVAVPAGAFDEVHELCHRLGSDGAAAITPADVCPDDNAVTGDALVIVDYENAQWRHVAWDVAYLRVPWPTCWCSWRMPDDVTDAAVAAYRAVAAPAFPEIAGPGFERDVDAAVIGWALMSATIFLDNALGTEAPLSGRYRRAPTRRAMITHRLRLAAAMDELPAAAGLAGRLATVLGREWGEVGLQYARAFR